MKSREKWTGRKNPNSKKSDLWRKKIGKKRPLAKEKVAFFSSKDKAILGIGVPGSASFARSFFV